MKTFEQKYKNKIIQGDCIEVMKEMEDESVDCVITSPPYNVGIEYENYNDKREWEDYKEFIKKWTSEVYGVLKRDGRVAINIPYEVNVTDRGGRRFILSDYWQIMQEIGFNFAGIVDLKEDNPHRVKLTAWGSWLSPSAPYIYNPKECVLIAYKSEWKKQSKGISYFNNKNKKEFQNLTSGIWEYEAEKKKWTEANFSLGLPMKALKILTFENELVLDPFLGSGTTALACKKMKRNYIGIELSEKYINVAKKRINNIQEKLL